jgi:hypothetical protein
MIRIIREGRIQHNTEYTLTFDTSRTGGFAFPCDHKGRLMPLSHEAHVNYERCRSGEVQTIRPPYVKERTWTEYIPAVGECYCGAEIELRPDNEGLCYCYCGKTYNSAGQEIRPRSEWEEY